MSNRSFKQILSVAIASAVILTLGSCASSAEPEKTAKPADKIVFWTPQTTPERLAKQEAVAAAFTEKTGIKVEVVPLAGADQNQALVTGAASGNVPDVIMHSADQAATWNEQGLLDTDVAQEVVDKLGADTFSKQALDIVTLDGTLASVPTDGWSHLISYRKDLLAAAGLKPPKSVEDVAEIATELHSGSMSGIALGTQPGTPSSTEALESILQLAGCQLVTDGKVTIDSKECVKGLELFKTMADSSAAGQFDVPAARAAYLAGNAAMLLFSTHIIDELAGLDPINVPSCAECAGDPQFLSKNTGFVTVLDPKNPAQFGATLNYGVPTGAHTKEAAQYIEFVMSEGYLDTLAVATEGRVPLRSGTKDSPSEYVDAWGELPFGSTAGSKLSIKDVYGEDLVRSLIEGSDAISRWGFGTSDSVLAGTVSAQNILSQNLEQLLAGDSAAAVAKTMAEQVTAAQQDLGGQ